MEADDKLVGVGCLALLVIVALLGIGGILHLGWNLIASNPRPQVHNPRRSQVALTIEQTERVQTDFARQALKDLDQFDVINNNLRSAGGVLAKLDISVRRMLGNADITSFDLMSSDPTYLPDKIGKTPFYYKMAVGFRDALANSKAANTAFSESARREATNIIDRAYFRDGWRTTHQDMLGADEAYLAEHLPPGWSIRRIK